MRQSMSSEVGCDRSCAVEQYFHSFIHSLEKKMTAKLWLASAAAPDETDCHVTHRLHRVPFVGVPRAAINARMRRGDPGLGGGGPVIHPVRAVDFLGFQQHIHAHDVRVGA